MIQITTTILLSTIGGLFSACLALIVYIYNKQSDRISKIEDTQVKCPVNKIYTLIEKDQTDIDWIKRELKKKN